MYFLQPSIACRSTGMLRFVSLRWHRSTLSMLVYVNRSCVAFSRNMYSRTFALLHLHSIYNRMVVTGNSRSVQSQLRYEHLFVFVTINSFVRLHKWACLSNVYFVAPMSAIAFVSAETNARIFDTSENWNIEIQMLCYNVVGLFSLLPHTLFRSVTTFFSGNFARYCLCCIWLQYDMLNNAFADQANFVEQPCFTQMWKFGWPCCHHEVKHINYFQIIFVLSLWRFYALSQTNEIDSLSCQEAPYAQISSIQE